VERAARCRVVRASGLESEIELTFGALHQLCAGLLARRNALPEPQADALAIAFGLKVGTPPDRLFVGLAVLGLVSKDGARRMAAAPSKVTGCARLAGQLVPARLVRRRNGHTVRMSVVMIGRWVAAVAGGLLVLTAWASVVVTLIGARPVGNWVDRLVNGAFRLATSRMADYTRRDRILAGQAAAILLTQLAAWLGSRSWGTGCCCGR
jgi:hypothetical protein